MKPPHEPDITEAALQRAVDHLSDVIDARFHALETALVDRVGSLDRLTEAKFITLQTLMDASADKVAIALAASDKAVSKAEIANDKRFETVAQLRDMLTEQSSRLMPRAESVTLHAATTARLEAAMSASATTVNELKERLDRNEGRTHGFASSGTILVASVSLIATIVTIVGGILLIVK